MKLTRNRSYFEFALIAIVLGMAFVTFQLGGHKLVVLNLFYLPIILSGYFLGRASAGILALLCALAVTIATALDPAGFAAHFTPLLGALAVTVWAAVLGLAAMLIGTLCDERAAVVDELHQAYVGVVEVLSRYLQCGNPNIKGRSVRVAELSQLVAEEMKLSRKQIDDIRVGSLLFDLGNVEITTRLIARVVDTLGSSADHANKHTFAGTDLVHSLGTVLQGTAPLLMSQGDDVSGLLTTTDDWQSSDVPLGAKIIRSVRAYDVLVTGGPGGTGTTPEAAINELRSDPTNAHDENVLRAVERVVRRSVNNPVHAPAYA